LLMNTPEPWRPTREDDGPSPLQRSMRGTWLLLGGLFVLMALIGLLGVGLSFMTYEDTAAWDSATPMLAFSMLTGIPSVVFFWLARRRVPAATASGWAPATWSDHTWQRRYRLPAWTDWLVLLFPAGFTLALAVKATRELVLQTTPVTTGDLAGAGGSVLLVAVLFSALVAFPLREARREVVRVVLHADGVLIVRRDGKERLLHRREVQSVFLATVDVSGLGVGAVGVALPGGERVSLREPLSAPLPHVAEHLARHLGVPVVRG